MKNVYLSLLLLGILSSPLAAINTDSLQTVINAQSGEAKLRSLLSASQKSLAEQELNSAQKWSNEALVLAQSIGNQNFISEAYNQSGLVCQAKYDYTNAMKAFVESLKIRDGLRDTKAIAEIKNNIGKVFLLQGDNDAAQLNLSKALELWLQAGDKEGLAEVSKNLGDLFIEQQIYGKAKEQYKRAMDLWVELKEQDKAAKVATQLGNIVYDLGDYEGALVYHQTSLDLNSSLNKPANIAIDLVNITNIHIKQSNYEEAEKTIASVVQLRTDLRDTLGLAEATQLCGLIAAVSGDKSKAAAYLAQAAAYVRATPIRQGSDKIYKAIAETYAKLSDYTRAYQYFQTYATAKEEVANQQRSKALLDLTTRYESEFSAKESQAKIDRLEQDKSNSRKTNYFLLALLGLGLALAYNLYVNNKRKQRANLILHAKNQEISLQKAAIDAQNDILEDKNKTLDVMNSKLINEIAEREAIEQSSFARDSFLATMSNQMRTPINVMAGLTHLLLEDQPRPEQTEHLRTLQFSANSLIVFINDMLDYSKIEAGKLNIEHRLFSTEKIFKDINDRYAPTIRNKGVQFLMNVDPTIPTKLIGDPARLNQILTNMVLNAIQFTNSGSINLNITLDRKGSTTKQSSLILHIKDTGKGNDKEKLEEMLQKFSYDKDEIFDGQGGSGLGLAIMKRLVELQNGTVQAESEEGKGTTIICVLPFRNAELLLETIDKQPINNSHLANKKVLLVEDNKINQLVVAKMLRKLGIEITTADDGLKALDFLSQNDYHLILMDIQMPGMDGYRATAEIRKMVNPIKRDVPIIALTASAFLTEKEKAQL
ncbi:MAG: hypothetical protein RLZZ292_1054, partial [Bacteroidota bacterium]